MLLKVEGLLGVWVGWRGWLVSHITNSPKKKLLLWKVIIDWFLNRNISLLFDPTSLIRNIRFQLCLDMTCLQDLLES